MAAYALRPMSTGEILDGALTLLRRHFGLLCGLAIVCQGLPTVLDVYLELAGGTAEHPGLSLLDRLLTWFGSLLVSGGTVWVVSETYLGRVPRLRDALGFAGDHVGDVFGAGLAAGLVTLLATLALAGTIEGLLSASDARVAFKYGASALTVALLVLYFWSGWTYLKSSETG